MIIDTGGSFAWKAPKAIDEGQATAGSLQLTGWDVIRVGGMIYSIP